MLSPAVEAVQEMQVVRNTYDAQYGKSGGIVALVSKSGTGEFHWTGYELIRAENLDATTWANDVWVNPGCDTPECGREKKGEFKRHQFGGNIGGPIWKSKNLFFFAGYEGLREPYTGSSGPRTVPTELEQRGDFSQTYNPDGTLQVIYNPFTTRPDPANPGQYIRDAFDPSCEGVVYPNTCAGNAVPGGLVDTVGQNVANPYSLPTSSGEGLAHLNNFFKIGPGQQLNDKIVARIDWVHNDKHRMFERWSQRLRQPTNQPCSFCNGTDAEFDSRNVGFHLALDNTFTPSPSWVVRVLTGSGFWRERHFRVGYKKANASAIDLHPALFHASILPAFDVDAFSSPGHPSG